MHDHQIVAGPAVATALRARSVSDDVIRRAAETPEALAIVFANRRVSYRALVGQASELARRLAQAGIEPGRIVAVDTRDPVSTVVAQLAILMAGCAYLPMHAKSPAERKSAVLAAVGAAIVIGQAGAPHTVELRATAGTPRTVPVSVACVMQTSGTTGTPLAVTITHAAIRNLVVDCGYVPLSTQTVVGQLSDTAFDAATFEIWGPLLNGGTVCILRPALLAAVGQTLAAVAGSRPTVLFLTTALFEKLARNAPASLDSVDWLLFGGEKCNPRVVREFVDRPFSGHLLHMYGPTEATTFTTVHEVYPGSIQPDATGVPIGRSIAGAHVEIVDDCLRPLSPGVVGEILIGGVGLSPGYLEGTAESQAKWTTDQDGRHRFRTGDYGIFGDDGVLEFRGRIDRQVKVRGHRVELEDIEMALSRNERVAAAVAAGVPSDNGVVLEAFIVSSLTANEILSYLAEQLPAYMIPRRVHVVDELPLTPNGKVDVNSLRRNAERPNA